MRLSEMTTEQGRQTIVKILPHIRNLTANGKLKAMLTGGVEKQKSGDPIGATLTATVDIALALLEDGSADSYGIIAGLTQKSVKAIKEQPLKDTIADLESCVDKELIDFFTSAVRSATSNLTG